VLAGVTASAGVDLGRRNRTAFAAPWCDPRTHDRETHLQGTAPIR